MAADSHAIPTNDLQDAVAEGFYRRPQRSLMFDTVLCILGTCLIYLLSYGPVAMMYRQSILSSSAWHAGITTMLYSPVEYAMRNETVKAGMVYYIETWEHAFGMSSPG